MLIYGPFRNSQPTEEPDLRIKGVTTVMRTHSICLLSLAVFFISSTQPVFLSAASWDPAATDYSGNRGRTFYVSKLGDNSDGSSWAKAFHTIQAALSAVPDDKGGHRIIVRPDTYVEANLAPQHPGAEGAYNALIGDFDGSLGSGAKGWVLIDSGDPEKGFKSWDWWSTMRASSVHWPHGNNQETFSSILFDRWIFRNLYTAGGDAGMFWDLTDKSGNGFTVVVEDCICTGRAFGGGVCYPVVRPKEPSTFRRCYFLALDFVGDTAAVLLGGWEKTMPDSPHAVFEDCTMVHPDNAVGLSYASNCARAKFTNCRMIVLNFTQPEMGGKSTGILCTQGPIKPERRLHIDLEDCTLAGYSVFTPGDESKLISYTTKGKVKAYVQFKQPMPEGFERLGLWPVDLFSQIAPPKTPEELLQKRVVPPRVETEEEHDRRMQRWRDARFGMFIHWGIMSIPGKGWNVMEANKIPVSEYQKLVQQYNPVQWNAHNVVKMAKDAGQKYIVFVAKHADGFCMWDSKLTDYDIMKTPYGRDIVRELADECAKQGIVFCFYYSILDWHHPDANPDNWPKYVDYMKGQLRELLTNYGPIGVVWFDGDWIPEWTDDQGRDLARYIWTFQPQAIINNRIGKVRQVSDDKKKDCYAADFGTPEQELPAGRISDFDWESCMTINNSWSWVKSDTQHKTPGECIRMLAETISKGGNLLLDIGPMPDGSIVQSQRDRLEKMGHWMQANSDAIYGTTASPFAEALPWGQCMTKTLPDGRMRLYLMVFDWPKDGRLSFPRMNDRNVERAYLLADAQHDPLPIEVDKGQWSISVPAAPSDPYVSVIAVDMTAL